MDISAGFSERYCFDATFKKAVNSLSAIRTGRVGINCSDGDVVCRVMGFGLEERVIGLNFFRDMVASNL